MTVNYQCKTCGLCMPKTFVSEHRWLTGHKIIIQKNVEDIAKEIRESIERMPMALEFE